MLKLAGEFTEGQLADHMAELDAHTYSWMQKLKTGEYFLPVPYETVFTFALTADRIVAVPFVVARSMTIDRLAIEVTAAAVADKVARLGIYNDGTNLYPGSLVKDYGTVTVDSTGIKVAAGDQALTKGIYWLVIVSDGAPTVRAYIPTWSILGQPATVFDRNNTNGNWYKAGVGSGALADPFVSGATLYTYYQPSILPRLKSLD